MYYGDVSGEQSCFQTVRSLKVTFAKKVIITRQSVWPSGLRRYVQVVVLSGERGFESLR